MLQVNQTAYGFLATHGHDHLFLLHRVAHAHAAARRALHLEVPDSRGKPHAVEHHTSRLLRLEAAIGAAGDRVAAERQGNGMVVERRARNASVHQPRGEGEGVGRCAQENVSGRPVQQGGDREERGALEGRCVHARVEEEVAKGLGEGEGGRA